MTSLLSGCGKQEMIAVGTIAAVVVAAPIVLPYAAMTTKSDVKKAFPDSTQTQMLAKASGKGDLSKIDKLIAKGADVNAKGKDGITVLAWALHSKNYRGFNHLLKIGADPNITWGKDLPEYFYVRDSVMHSAEGIFLQTALEAGGNPNLSSDGKRVVETKHWYCNIGDFKILEPYGLEYEFITEDGSPFINTLAYRKCYNLICYILKKGVNTSLKDQYGSTLFDIMQTSIARLDRSTYAWLNDTQKKWLWSCVEIMENKGYDFSLSPTAQAERINDMEDKPTSS